MVGLGNTGPTIRTEYLQLIRAARSCSKSKVLETSDNPEPRTKLYSSARRGSGVAYMCARYVRFAADPFPAVSSVGGLYPIDPRVPVRLWRQALRD